MKSKSLDIWITSVLLISLFQLSCSSGIEFSREPVVVQNPNKSTPLTCFIDFETTLPHEKVTFVIKDTDREYQLDYTPDRKMAYGYLIFLMRPAQENRISVEITDTKGKKYSAENELIYNTPPLPEGEAEFPRIEITKRKSVGETDELILFNPRRRTTRRMAASIGFGQNFGMLSIINQKGDVLWYHTTDSRISDFDLLENGNISYVTQDYQIVEMDLAGNKIHWWYAANRPEGQLDAAVAVDALTFHHDVSVLPNGNRLALSTEVREFDNYYTSETDENAPRKRQKVMGDVIVEFNLEGEIVHRWSCFDHMPVERIGYETFSNYWIRRGFPEVIDWSHANAVVPLPDEDAYLVNFRYQSAMIKVNKTSGEIEWIFAEPSGWGEELQEKLLKIPEEGWNWHQHSPRFMANGNLLFFNNNNYKARPFDEPANMRDCPSYVVEYKINEESKTVEHIWDSLIEGENDIVSTAMGRVGEIPGTGNILAGYGAVVSQEHIDEMTWFNRMGYPQWTMVREFAHTTPAHIIWEMRLLPKTKESGVSWTLFGADQIEFQNVKE
jgi:hypothetical protein